MESRAHSGSIRRFAMWMPALVAGFFVFAALAPAMAGAAASFRVSPDDPPDCVWIRGFSPNSPLTVTIDDPGTARTDDYVFTRTADPSGNYNFDSEQPRPDFSAGWQITVADGVASVTHEVLNLGFVGFDVAEDSCWGWSQFPNSTVNVGFWCDDLGTYISRVVPTDGARSWSVDFTLPVGDGLGKNQGANFKITDTATVTQGDGGGGATQTNGRPVNPQIFVYPNDDIIDGQRWRPATNVTINIDRGGAGGGFEYSGTVQVNENGNWWINSGDEFDILPGDVVSATDGTWSPETIVTVLQVTLADVDTDTIRGTAAPGSWVSINVFTGTPLLVQADINGDWSVGAGFDMVVGANFQAYQRDEDWDRTQINWRILNPHIGADPVNEQISGWEWGNGTALIVSLDGQVVGAPTCDQDGNFNISVPVGFDIVEGSIVEVTGGSMPKSMIVTGLTITELNDVNDTISGTAAINSYVHVWVYNGAHRLVQANDVGFWTAYFAIPAEGEQVCTVDPGSSGNANQVEADSDQTQIQWHLANPNFGVDPDSGDVWGGDWTDPVLNLSVDDPATTEVTPDFQTTVNTGGMYWGTNLNDQFDIEPGHVVRVWDSMNDRQHTVAALSVTEFNLLGDMVAGTGPEGQWLVVSVGNWAASRNVQVSGGYWVADFSVAGEGENIFNIVPGTQGEVHWNDTDNDTTRLMWHVLNPHFGADPAREEIWGNDFAPSTTVTITVNDGAGGFERTADTDWQGNFGVSLEWDFDIQPGHVVMVTDGITTHVHEVIALIVTDIDVDANTVSGTGAPGGWVDVDVYGMASRGAQIDGLGNWMVNFAVGESWEGTADLTLGTQGEARQHDGDWDYTRTVWHVLNPRFTVNPEVQEVYGNDFAPSTVVTITIDDPGAGGPVDWQTTVETDAWGNFDAGFWGEFELLPGHVVTVTDGVIIKTHTVLSVQVTDIDPVAETVSGTADPFAWVQVNVWDTGSGKQVQADELGGWTADFSTGEYWELADIMLGSEGSAQRWDESSDMTEDGWRLANPVISIRPWDDNFGIYDFPRNAGVTLEIDDPGIPGAPNFTRELTTDDWGTVEEWLDPAVFDLKAGQTVTATSGDVVKSHTIMALSITSIDPDTDTMTGTSNPAFQVVVDNWWYEGEWYPDADESGNWTLTGMPLDPMNEGSVAQWDEEGDSTDGGWRVLAPRMEVNPDVENIRFYDWPTDAEIAIEIDDPGIPGDPNYSALLTPDEWGNFELWLDPAAFDIHAGQTITATFGTIVKKHTVTTLSITAAQEGTLSGTGDFGTEVNFSDWQGWWWGQRNVWPDESGNWTFPDEQLSKGGSGDASQWDDDWDYTRVEWHILNPAFAVDLTYRNMDGWDWLPSTDLAISIDHPGGPTPDHTYSCVTDEYGNFWFDADGAGLDVIPGDIMTVTDGQTPKRHVVLAVAVTSADPDTDIVAGTFAPDAWLSVSAWTPSDGQERNTQCDNVGNWSIYFKTSWMGNPPLDLLPGSDVQAAVGDDDGDMTRSTWHIPDPRFRVSPMHEDVYGEEWPADTSLLITYDDPTTGLLPDVTTSTVTGPMGDFQMNLAAAGVDIKTGDVVTVTDGETLKEHIVLPVSVSGVNPDNDTVWGTAAPDSMVWVSIDDQEYWGGVEVETDVSGNWTADFSFIGMGSWDIVPGTTGNVNQSDDDNDETWVSWSAGPPRFTVAPNSDSVWGVNWENSGEVSISVNDPHNGASVDWQDVVATSEWLGEFWIETTGYNVLPGDIVTVTDGSSTKTHAVTALTVAGANIDTNVVYGATDSYDTVRVGYFPDGWWGPALVEVQPDHTWTYGFTLNDPPLDLQLGNEAAADQVDADGDATWVDWWIVTPVPALDDESTYEDTTLSIDAPGLLGNDVYNSGETQIATTTSPAHGDLTVDADTGAWTYVPDENWAGEDSFTYVLTQGTFESAPATVLITVTEVNDVPIAVDDEYVTPDETRLDVAAPGVLANDVDVDSPIEANRSVGYSGPSNGNLGMSTDGSFYYTPNPGFSGVDTFTYQVWDGTVLSDFATVTIYVTSVNVPPTARNDTATTPEDTPLTAAARGVLGNDTDVNGDPMIPIKVSDPAHGTVTLNANGSYTYTPVANYVGPDSFTYKVNDGLVDSNIATVNITVTSVNDAPVAMADGPWAVVQDTVLNRLAPGVLSNDSDLEGSPLTAGLVTGVSHGTLVLSANGSFVYTPTSGYIGPDSFTYRAYDGAAYSTPVTVSLDVNPVDLVEVPIQGGTRFSTSVAVSLKAFPDGSDWVVIATGRNWPDALGGSALAGALGGPILLTDTTVMPAEVVAEIKRLEATNAIILGGTSAVALSVETALNGLLGDANVERIGKGTRYLTADAVAARAIQELGAAYDGTAFMATGTNYPDALAAAPLSAGLHWPLYLTRPTGVTAETYVAMTGVDEVLILGGTGAVPAMIESSLVTRYTDPNVTRLFGGTRYETAVAVATYGVNHGLGWNRLALATGEKFPDALAGGILQGLDGSVMLLTRSNSLDPAVAAVLTAHANEISEVRYLGGTSALSQGVRDAVANLLD